MPSIRRRFCAALLRVTRARALICSARERKPAAPAREPSDFETCAPASCNRAHSLC